ncbi:tetratricopeptide repeat protein [Halioxenophilus sp. WMMB6]|uniref:tetratricopeptide repeat protein n=1 Tax=Halioxenophilus sp. WMMB6 TaxID=3073815 RepID=UPI00295F4CB6|nr:tetratricopeptide repeat protein [Halioxenophilus sp. WMMB6]
MYRNIEKDDFDGRWIDAVDLYRKGDKTGALFRFKKLAQEGCAAALVEIGNIYERGGGGVSSDVFEAEVWYLRSVEVLDDPKAHLALGRIYLDFSGFSQRFDKAHYHLSLLEDSSEMGAFYGLGLIYEKGLGVREDVEKALAFYQKAMTLGHIGALRNAARLLFKIQPGTALKLWLRYTRLSLSLGKRLKIDRRMLVA